ncbi:MAG TPA: FAD-dependent monooxygenase [Streptosporangiaceae bacterium]
MTTALQDVVNLGWKLAAQLRGWAPPGLLDTLWVPGNRSWVLTCGFTMGAATARYHPPTRTPLFP